MGVQNILDREDEINNRIFIKLKNLHILAEEHQDILGIFSFYIDDAHYNLMEKLLNDRFGVQTRGGCSCAGTYGYYLLNVNQSTSKAIEQKILKGCLLERSGWGMAIHPTMTNAEIDFIYKCIKYMAKNFKDWSKEYNYNLVKNEFEYINGSDEEIIETRKNWLKI
jgi:selenocysteine lyase/cysteine desulfurase